MAAAEYDRLLKVLVVGDAGVGKSALITRFVDDAYTDYYVSTIGIDFKLRTVDIDGKVIKLQVWDTAGQERFQSVTRSFFRGADAVIIAYDVGRRESFDNVRKWLEMVDAGSREGVVKMLVGNKVDLPDDAREISVAEGKTFAQGWDLLFCETSAKEDLNVEEAFFELVGEACARSPAAAPPVCYGPPPRPRPAAGACCHRLGPPGNLFHVGSAADRQLVAKASETLSGARELVIAADADECNIKVTAAELSHALHDGVPLVLRGFHRQLGEEARGALELGALRRRFGGRALEVSPLAPGGRSLPPFRRVEMSFEDFLLQTLDAETDEAGRRSLYLQQLPLEAFLPELAASGVPLRGPAALREALGQELLVTSTLFCGAAGVRTSLHFDRGDYSLQGDRCDAESSIDNLFLQLAGHKRFELFRPCDHARFYPRGRTDLGAPHVSCIEDTEDVDAAVFPLFHEAYTRRLIVELGPGDALLIPRWWWHQTTAVTDGTAINWWFETVDGRH